MNRPPLTDEQKRNLKNLIEVGRRLFKKAEDPIEQSFILFTEFSNSTYWEQYFFYLCSVFEHVLLPVYTILLTIIIITCRLCSVSVLRSPV